MPTPINISTEEMTSQPSKLEQLRERYERQQADKNERRLIELYEEQIHRERTLTNSAPELQGGKVRQLFQQRRVQQKTKPMTSAKSAAVGRDRSYPLPPFRHKQRRQTQPDEDKVDDVENVETAKPYDITIFGKLPNLGGVLKSTKPQTDVGEKKFSTLITNGRKSPKDLGLKTVTKKMTKLSVVEPIPPKRQVSSRSVSKPNASPSTASNTKSNSDINDGDKTSANTTPIKRQKPQKSLSPVQSAKSNYDTTTKTMNDGLVECKVCGRRFATDRIQLHEQICKKAQIKKNKRKVFDPVKQRLQGTEAYSYMRKNKQQNKKAESKPSPPKSDWRKQHEEFVRNIREAKMVQKHLAEGGKLSDLPPPPPSDTSHYVQCKHCGRKFNAGAAERHIPKCANIVHKPAPPPRRKAAR